MNARLISRPDVERRLRTAVERTPLTLLQAPLGAGKSSAAKMAFLSTPGVVWMEARPWHRDAFVRDIVDTVRSVRADFGRMTLGALEAGASAAHIGTTFATELAHIDEPLTLIVDNAHVFAGGPAFSHFVDAAVEALPESAHILVIGRALPDVALGKFAGGRAQIVAGDLLVFNAGDIRAMGLHFGREFDDEAITAIEKSTEGWAAGVTLAVTAPRATVPAADPRDAAETYLTEELLSRLDPQAVSFLERAAVFETLDLQIVSTIDGFSQARDLIATLRKGGALLTEVGAGRYRLHPVLRELSERRLRERDALSAAHRDAAEAYMRAGELAAALFHANESADPATAASFLRNHAAAAVATGNRAEVRQLSTRIERNGRNAGIRWYVDALLGKASASTDVRSTLSRAIDAADASEDTAIAFQARAQAIEYDIGHLVRVDDESFDDLARRAEPLGLAAVETTLVMRGWSRAIVHDFSGALVTVAPLAGSGDATVRFNVEILRAYAQTALGLVDESEETLDALIALLENDDKVVLQTLTLVWFARLALVRNHTTAASDAAAHAERLASALDLRAEEAALYVALAEIATHHGDADAAIRYAERAKARAGQAWYAGDVSRVRAFAEIVVARAAFLGNDYAIAREVADRAAAQSDFPNVQRAVALAESAIYTLLSEPSAASASIARAREALAIASPADAADAAALATADDLLAFLDAANDTAHASLLSGSETFASLIAHRRGLVTLEHTGIAVGNARRGLDNNSTAFETSLQLFTRDGPRFEARLARAYAGSFMKSRRSSQPAAPDLNLTAREQEILALLIDGLTNKEIAQRLIVSPRTVETHVERILGKLEVGSRSRAIAKAIRLGIVSLVRPQ